MCERPLTDQEIYEAKELCVQLGECTATLWLCMLIREVERLKLAIPAERVTSRLMGLDDGLKANCADHLLTALKAVRDDPGLNDLIAGVGEKPDFLGSNARCDR